MYYLTINSKIIIYIYIYIYIYSNRTYLSKAIIVMVKVEMYTDMPIANGDSLQRNWLAKYLAKNSSVPNKHDWVTEELCWIDWLMIYRSGSLCDVLIDVNTSLQSNGLLDYNNTMVAKAVNALVFIIWNRDMVISEETLFFIFYGNCRLSNYIWQIWIVYYINYKIIAFIKPMCNF